MSRFHTALRRAFVARLGTDLGAKVYSSPPSNVSPPYILVGAIVAEPVETKASPAAFHLVAVESWVQSRSPADLDALTDAVVTRLTASNLTDAEAALSRPILHGTEADTWNPDAAGGPTIGRVQTFRLFAQPVV